MELNTLRPRQNGHRFPDDIFKCIFLNEKVWISLKISLKFIPKVRINNIPALVRIMARHRPGDKLLSEPMMGNSLTHICTRPQWVNSEITFPQRLLLWANMLFGMVELMIWPKIIWIYIFPKIFKIPTFFNWTFHFITCYIISYNDDF